MRARDRLFFYENCSSLLRGGVPLVQALSLIEKRSTIRSIKQFSRKLKKGVEQGNSMYSQIKDFPEEEMVLVEAGEKSGELVAIFEHLVEKIRKDLELISFVIVRMWQPIFLLLCGLFLFPGIEYFLGQISAFTFICHSFLPALLLVGGILFVCFNWPRSSIFRKKMLRSFLRIPYVSQTVIIFQNYKFILVYSMLTRAGIEMGQLLKSSGKVMFTQKALKAVSQAKKAKEEGVEVIQSFKGVLSSDHISRWKLALDGGREEEMLTVISSELKTTLNNRIELIARMIPKVVYFIAASLAVYKLFYFVNLSLGEIDKLGEF